MIFFRFNDSIFFSFNFSEMNKGFPIICFSASSFGSSEYTYIGRSTISSLFLGILLSVLNSPFSLSFKLSSSENTLSINLKSFFKFSRTFLSPSLSSSIPEYCFPSSFNSSAYSRRIFATLSNQVSSASPSILYSSLISSSSLSIFALSTADLIRSSR